jgi:ABC-type nitrate/sulfonate/bicarbonate transport system permease component
MATTSAAPNRNVTRPRGGFRLTWRSWYSVLILALTWEVLSRLAIINPFFLPPPTLLAVRTVELLMTGDLEINALATLLRALAALALATLVGVPLGIGMARVPAVRWFFDPLVSLGFPTPKVALWPIFVLWFGFFDTSKIILTAVACVFPIISATYLATFNVDRFLIWSARNLGTSEQAMLWRVVFRAALPEIITGIQTALPIAFIVVVLTEMLSGGTGLGSMIMLANRFADMQTVLVGVIAAAVIGFAAIKAVELVRTRALAWHQETGTV